MMHRAFRKNAGVTGDKMIRRYHGADRYESAIIPLFPPNVTTVIDVSRFYVLPVVYPVPINFSDGARMQGGRVLE